MSARKTGVRDRHGELALFSHPAPRKEGPNTSQLRSRRTAHGCTLSPRLRTRRGTHDPGAPRRDGRRRVRPMPLGSAARKRLTRLRADRAPVGPTARDDAAACMPAAEVTSKATSMPTQHACASDPRPASCDAAARRQPPGAGGCSARGLRRRRSRRWLRLRRSARTAAAPGRDCACTVRPTPTCEGEATQHSRPRPANQRHLAPKGRPSAGGPGEKPSWLPARAILQPTSRAGEAPPGRVQRTAAAAAAREEAEGGQAEVDEWGASPAQANGVAAGRCGSGVQAGRLGPYVRGRERSRRPRAWAGRSGAGGRGREQTRQARGRLRRASGRPAVGDPAGRRTRPRRPDAAPAARRGRRPG